MNQEETAPSSRKNILSYYTRTPLWIRILIALVLGITCGLIFKEKMQQFGAITSLVLKLLTALATPLILFAVMQAILKAKIGGKMAGRLVFLLATNTLMAIIIGLVVANLVKPGSQVSIPPPAKYERQTDLGKSFIDMVPTSIVGSIAENKVIAVIVIAITFAIALRGMKKQATGNLAESIALLERFLELGFHLIIRVLHWVIELVPFAVFGIVAEKVGKENLNAFRPLLYFVFAVILALLLQAVYYNVRLLFASWVKPGRFLKGGSEAFLMAFSTASSSVTLPVTYRCATEKIGLRTESANMGVMVGGNLNNDGTALYEAMAALFVSQLIGQSLGLPAQIVVVFMSVVAAVGAAGIPEAGLVTMIAVFKAVNLPIEYIPVLLVVDWFLDRCRTTINVMGDLTVSSILDGKTRPEPEEIAAVESNPEPEPAS